MDKESLDSQIGYLNFKLGELDFDIAEAKKHLEGMIALRKAYELREKQLWKERKKLK